ncbi:DUF6944 family repetitive protein [Paenibacillus dakarensis]|uniref:DUF6944 family repetitive protein n=1 Tax=Paenibacillus dakarensis TaxID=1527293 RepID=UPI0006D59B81|nr:hypothetical protein [Paenibacillus dakarensis]
MSQIAAYAWLQALGTNITAIGQTRLLNKTKAAEVQGNEMVLLGNAMQSISNTAQTKIILEQGGSQSDLLNALGSSLQAMGSTIQVVAGIKTLVPGRRTRHRRK